MLENLTRTYTIAFAMRSGSNEICSLLTHNGLGAPTELFQYPFPPEPDPTQLTGFLSVVQERQVNGIFGSKMSHNHRAALDEYFRNYVPGYRQLDDVLPNHRWVWLTRRDKILQAISLCRAEQSNVWAATSSTRVESDRFNYDFLEILSRLVMLLTADFIWQLYFQREGITPLAIIYEDFFENIEAQLKLLIDYLGGPCGRYSQLDITSRYAIQRTNADAAIRERFSEELCRLGEVGLARQFGLPLELWNQFFFGYGWRQGVLT
ncbi:MAG: Stf0 family sulfotransferase [Candidatus Korobacteraceae bacterium]